MLQTHNNQKERVLPYLRSQSTDPAFLMAAQFLYSQYPGIFKMKISKWEPHKNRRGAFIRLESVGKPARQTSARGYSLGNAVANLIGKIKADENLTDHLRHPEKYI